MSAIERETLVRKFLFVAMIGVLALSVGCKKAATPAENGSQSAATSSSAASTLPQVCSDYLDRAAACYKQANPQMAAPMQMALDKVKAQWSEQLTAAGYNAAAMEAGCKAASDSFDKTIKPMLKCN